MVCKVATQVWLWATPAPIDVRCVRTPHRCTPPMSRSPPRPLRDVGRGEPGMHTVRTAPKGITALCVRTCMPLIP
eukprot:gene8731-biopygen10680